MSTPPLLRIDALGVDLLLDGVPRTVVHRADVSISEGTAVALVGESGSGKSLTARSVMGLLPETARVHGDVREQVRQQVAQPDAGGGCAEELERRHVRQVPLLDRGGSYDAGDQGEVGDREGDDRRGEPGTEHRGDE
ncbi:ATP-binding cassette domain-containing protein, partial [Streptomyces sp. ms191]